jgi:hypothetical protein
MFVTVNSYGNELIYENFTLFVMSKFSIYSKILLNNMFNPKNFISLAKERFEVNQDSEHQNHKYEYDYNSIHEFFKNKFPKENILEYELELNDIELHVDDFFKKIDLEKYPSLKKPYPADYSINKNSRNFLYFICRILKPKIVVETGVAYGLSSLYILKALENNNSGKLYSVDSVFRPWHSKNMIGSIIPENLKTNWNLILGSSNKVLPNLFNNLTQVDIFIHDSLHTYKNMMFEFECALNNIKNGMIISDDILGNDAFHDFSIKNNIINNLIQVDNNTGLGIIGKL